MMSKGYDKFHVAAVSLSYSSPEMLSDEAFNEKTDMWALGCIIYEMVHLKLAYSGGTEEQLKNKIINQPVPVIQTGKVASTDLISLYNMCMKKDPRERASSKDILQSRAAQEWAHKLRIHIGVAPELVRVAESLAPVVTMSTPIQTQKQEIVRAEDVRVK